MLAFLTALAFVEVGAGAVVAQAWNLERKRGVLLLSERTQLSELLDRLRVMSGVVTAGAIATIVVWSLLAIYNAMRVARFGARRDAVIAFAAWITCPILVLAIAAGDYESQTTTTAVLLLMLQAVLLFMPFSTTGKVSEGVGGQRMPFLRWYVAVLAAYFVEHVFTAPLDLGDPKPGDDLGRTAVMYFVNAVIIGVMVVMAAEASRSMQQATLMRSSQRRLLSDDANQRVRVALSELPLVADPPPVTGQVGETVGVASLPAPSVFAPPAFPAPTTGPVPSESLLSVPAVSVAAPSEPAPGEPAKVLQFPVD